MKASQSRRSKLGANMVLGQAGLCKSWWGAVCLRFFSCLLCLPGAAEVTRQTFTVLLLGAKQELRRLIKSCESTSASVRAKQVLSSEGTDANLLTADGSQFPPPACPWMSHDRSSHVPPLFSPRKTDWTLESLVQVSRFMQEAEVPSNSPKRHPCFPGSANPGCCRAIKRLALPNKQWQIVD